jgi:hypothetical protein
VTVDPAAQSGTGWSERLSAHGDGNKSLEPPVATHLVFVAFTAALIGKREKKSRYLQWTGRRKEETAMELNPRPQHLYGKERIEQ